jgi:hypothetical protein
MLCIHACCTPPFNSFACPPAPPEAPACLPVCPEYSSTLHSVLVGLESSSLAPWKLLALAGGYLGLVLFTVYLASSEVRLPIVQYAKGPPPVSSSHVGYGQNPWAACAKQPVLTS